jgi:hypothetical protein
LEAIDALSSTRVAYEGCVDNVWLGVGSAATLLDAFGDRVKMPASSLVANHNMISIIYARPGRCSIKVAG